MFIAYAIAVMVNGSMQAAVSPTPYESLQACQEANTKVEEKLNSVDPKDSGVVMTHFGCVDSKEFNKTGLKA